MLPDSTFLNTSSSDYDASVEPKQGAFSVQNTGSKASQVTWTDSTVRML